MRLLPASCHVPGSGTGGEARTHLPQVAAATRPAVPGHWRRLGRLAAVGCRAPRRAGPWHYAVTRPARPCFAADRSERFARSRTNPFVGLPRTASGRTVRGLSGSDRAMIYVLAAYTGLRASEIGSLKTNSFDMNSATVTVEPLTITVKSSSTPTVKPVSLRTPNVPVVTSFSSLCKN